MHITMMYKQKGSGKKLENDRGSFIIVILTIIFEKVIKIASCQSLVEI